MKLDKVKVESKTRALSAKYTVEQSEDIEHMMGSELQKAIDDEILNTIVGPTLVNDGWIQVTVRNWESISQDWLDANIQDRHSYKCFGYYWYFKNKSDATIFTLRWA